MERVLQASPDALRYATATIAGRPPLRLSDPTDIEEGARAIVAGVGVFHGFGNFYVLTTNPAWPSMRRINLTKGRPEHQVGSLTTTRRHLESCFDWPQLPEGVTKAGMLALMDELYNMGPFGFRGPAAAHIPSHLSSMDGAVRTTQVIAPPYTCPSVRLLDAAMDRLGVDYLYCTSANRSRHLTGREEPAHWTAEGIAQDFAHDPAFLLMAHEDEAAARRAYPLFAPMSTTVLSFHKLASDGTGRPCLVVERHGSLPVGYVAVALARHGFGMVLGPGAMQRLSQRVYEEPAREEPRAA